MSSHDLSDKRKIFELIEANKFNETLDLTNLYIAKKSSQESTFRIGVRVLAALVNLKHREHLKTSFNIFSKWFDFCLGFEQNLVTKNSIIYYGIMHTKALLTEKLYEISLELLEKLQTLYTFLCDNKFDQDSERYIKYIAPLSYNQSINKDLIITNPNVAMNLFIHGVKFYAKYLSNFYTVFDSIRIFEFTFIKNNQLEYFYQVMFDFLFKSITDEDCCNSLSKIDPKKSLKHDINPIFDHRLKQIYLFKMYISLFIHYSAISHSNDISKAKEMINDHYSKLKLCFQNKPSELKSLYLYNKQELRAEINDIEITDDIFSLIDLITEYTNQYKKKTSSATSSSSCSSTTIVHILKENSMYEKKLRSSFSCFFMKTVEINSFYQHWILNNLFDFMMCSLSVYLNDSAVINRYLQESLIDFISTCAHLYAENIKNYHETHQEKDKIPKNIYYKIVSLFNMAEKLLEQIIKTNIQSKSPVSDLITDSCETTIKNHSDYLNWMNDTKILTGDELTKYYMAIESQTIRIGTQFYSEETMANYIRFQSLSLDVSLSRLRFLLNHQIIQQTRINLIDLNLLKNMRSIGENLLLSLRLKEKFDESKEIVKKVYEFHKEFHLERDEMEWIVTNWCKIKRDLWKSKSDQYSKLTIVDLLDIKSDLAFYYLFEEIRIYHFFKTLDASITMNDVIYHTLEKLDDLSSDDKILKCRVQLEIAQFCWINYKSNENKFNSQTSEQYLENAKNYLTSHSCSFSNDVIEIGNKENNDCSINSSSSSILSINNKKRLSSPTMDAIILEDIDLNEKTNTTAKRTLPKRRRILNSEQSPLLKSNKKQTKQSIQESNAKKEDVQPQIHANCDCLTSKIISFQLNLLNMLSNYAGYRKKMFNGLTNLIQSRMKIKDTTQITTNADSLHLQTVASQYLICPELCDENNLYINDESLIKQLDICYNILESITIKINLKELILNLEKNLLKQFFESMDLLAQMYGFFGMIVSRVKTLRIKLNLLYLDYDHLSQQNNDSIFSQTVINLMKALLNANMCDEYDELNKKLLSSSMINSTINDLKMQTIEEKFRNLSNLNTPTRTNKTIPIPLSATVQKSAIKKLDQTETISKDMLCNDETSTAIDKHKYIGNKPETLVAYYLTLTHYYILTKNYDEAIKIMCSKVKKSPILNGKQTAYFYEVKYYLRYLQFLLSMMNVGSKTAASEQQFQNLIEDETSLSLLEDCYTSAFSVARFYMQNSVEPSRAISALILTSNNTESKDENSIFFAVGNSECYRILSECLDLMQTICKYYIDISRYRDATGYIREALDITQLNFSIRRIGSFLLNQINADLTASCLNEANSRIKIIENLLCLNDLDLNSKRSKSFKLDNKFDLYNDFHKFKSYLNLTGLKIYRDIKSTDQSSSDLLNIVNVIKNTLSDNKQLNDYCKDELIDIAFIICNYLIKFMDKDTITKLLKLIKTYLIIKPSDAVKTSTSTSKLQLTSLQEKWHLAEYYCFLFEIDETNKTSLYYAYDFIKKNPHPQLYRRICLNLFKIEADSKQKISFLLETQSIALRHKICSIQLKHKRKSNIDATIYEKLLSTVSFGSNVANKDSLINFVDKILPSNCVVVSLVLIDNVDLFIVRLEKDNEPFLFKLKYNHKFSDEFRTIMVENDKSMKISERSKFWSSRSALNKRLYNYLEELETNVFSYAKSLLLGTYIKFNLSNLISQFKKDMKLETITKTQKSLLKLVYLGLEHYDIDDLRNALKTEFNEKSIEQYCSYLITQKALLSNAERKHVCLLTDKHLHQIPWECLPSTKSQPISRMPSIHFLSSHIQINSLKINKDKAFYIVDPGSDLTHTREKFQSFFEKRKNWNGIIGIPPNENQFKKALTDYELFIYTGHGSGSQYYPSDDVQKLRVQACSILMGCSSGNQYVMGDFEPYGTVLAYILAGCPCIVGNLWDVTDRDIDRLTEEFLESWIKDHEEKNNEDDNEDKNDHQFDSSTICVHLTKARKACKMAYLNGSAPIVYGLPVKFK